MADKKKQYKKKTDAVTKIDTFSKEQVLKAIEGSGAVVTTIANKLSIHRSTALRLIDMWEETKQAFYDEEHAMNDMAKNCILNAIHKGDVATAKWWSSKKNKAEGFGDEPPVVNVTNVPAQQNTETIKHNLDKLSPEERDMYLELCEKMNDTDSE